MTRPFLEIIGDIGILRERLFDVGKHLVEFAITHKIAVLRHKIGGLCLWHSKYATHIKVNEVAVLLVQFRQRRIDALRTYGVKIEVETHHLDISIDATKFHLKIGGLLARLQYNQGCKQYQKFFHLFSFW